MVKENVACMHSGIPFSSKKHGILEFEKIEMNLEDFMLSKISQAQKDKHYAISLISRI
jgi:hypothetical protein